MAAPASRGPGEGLPVSRVPVAEQGWDSHTEIVDGTAALPARACAGSTPVLSTAIWGPAT